MPRKSWSEAVQDGLVTGAQGVFGAKAIADLPYLTDYHVMPKRLTPGWEASVSGRSLLMIFNVLAASLPVRGLLKSRLDGRRFG